MTRLLANHSVSAFNAVLLLLASLPDAVRPATDHGVEALQPTIFSLQADVSCMGSSDISFRLACIMDSVTESNAAISASHAKQCARSAQVTAKL